MEQGTAPITPNVDTMPLDALEAQINAQSGQQPEAVPQAPTGDIPIVPQEVKEAPSQGQELSDAEKAQVEQPPAAKGAFAEFQQKSGVKSPDDLTINFLETKRKLTQISQENAELKRLEALNQFQQPQQPQYQPEDMTERFRQELESNPPAAIAGIVNALLESRLQPVEQERLTAKLDQVALRLGSSPDTADFQLPEVQNEIFKIIHANKRDFLLSDGRTINPEKLESAYYQARGRLYKPSINVAQPQQVTPQVVEGRSKSAPPQVVDIHNMSLDALEAHINSLEGNQGS